jgi:hypothetical protein
MYTFHERESIIFFFFLFSRAFFLKFSFNYTKVKISLVELEAQNMYGQTPLFYVLYQLGKCHAFKEHIDDMLGLPYKKEKDNWEAIKTLFIKYG